MRLQQGILFVCFLAFSLQAMEGDHSIRQKIMTFIGKEQNKCLFGKKNKQKRIIQDPKQTNIIVGKTNVAVRGPNFLWVFNSSCLSRLENFQLGVCYQVPRTGLFIVSSQQRTIARIDLDSGERWYKNLFPVAHTKKVSGIIYNKESKDIGLLIREKDKQSACLIDTESDKVYEALGLNNVKVIEFQGSYLITHSYVEETENSYTIVCNYWQKKKHGLVKDPNKTQSCELEKSDQISNNNHFYYQ